MAVITTGRHDVTITATGLSEKNGEVQINVSFVQEETGDTITAYHRFERRRRHYHERPEEARELLAQGETASPADLDPVVLAAMTTTASVLLNLDETITKE